MTDTKERHQVIQDEADAEQRQREYDRRHAKLKVERVEKEAPPPRAKAFDLSRLADDAPIPAATLAVQASAMDPETKKVFELLIVEIRKQIAGGGGGEPGTPPTDYDAFKKSVIADLNSLRDAIMLTNASLDADAGVATTTFAQGDPPPITTV